MRLPVIDPTVFDLQYRLDGEAWAEAIREVCSAHAIACRSVRAYTGGSNLVASVDERWVVKIFPPFHRHQWESERRVLPRFHGRLAIEVPALVAEGERDDGWTYVVIERIEGELLEDWYPTLDGAAKQRVLTQLGEVMAQAHALPSEGLADLPPPWHEFIDQQMAGCRARHERLGVPDWLVGGIDDFVQTWKPRGEPAAHVILTGEYTPFNVLVARDASGELSLSGMFDFGDAMIGPRDYDLLGPSLFSCRGEAALVRAFIAGYRGADRPIDHETRMRLMALALLHRYANFDFQLGIDGWRDRARSIEELALLVWPPR